jgi:peptidylprolyl isomerase
MITPLRAVLVAAILGAAIAIVLSLQTPPPPPEANLTEAQAPAPQPLGPPAPAPVTQPAAGPRTVTADGLTIIEVQPGTGAAAKSGDHIFVNYRGRLQSTGVQFDSSYDRGQPFDLVLGTGHVIAGWEEGLIGMKVGGKRQLIIPPSLGYGPNENGSIPANSTLVFDLELVRIQ